MKYDTQVQELKSKLTTSLNVLMVLPSNCGVDCLAAGLSLYLSFKNSGKNVSIASEKTLQVTHTNLFGIGSIQNSLPSNGTGTWVLTIGGAVDGVGKAVFEKVDYSMIGSDLRLKFPIVSGQKFEPTHITPSFEGANFDLVLVIGSANLESLGGLFSQNQPLFSSSFVVNIDNSAANSQFGNLKVVDSTASSLSEMVGLLIPGLGLSIDADISTNILTGVYGGSNNLNSTNTNPETFEVIAMAMRAGGKKPLVQISDMNQVALPSDEPVATSLATPNNTSGFDFTQMYKPDPAPFAGTPVINDPFMVPLVVNSTPPMVTSDFAPNTHEREVITETNASGMEVEEVIQPEDDWLTPKIYSGKSIG